MAHPNYSSMGDEALPYFFENRNEAPVLSVSRDSGYRSRSKETPFSQQFDGNQTIPTDNLDFVPEYAVAHEQPRLNAVSRSAPPSIGLPRNIEGYPANLVVTQHLHSGSNSNPGYAYNSQFPPQPSWYPQQQSILPEGHSTNTADFQPFLEDVQIQRQDLGSLPTLLRFEGPFASSELSPSISHEACGSDYHMVSNGPSLRAAACAKFWIKLYPGKCPSDKDRKLLATLANERLESIEKAFGEILTSNSVREHRESHEPLCKSDTGEVQSVNTDESYIVDPQVLRNAAEWVSRQDTKCRALKVSRELPEEGRPRIYKCTVGCEMTFADKDNWKRHEELRFPQRGWVCGLGPTILIRGILQCTHCGLPNPEMHHLQYEHPELATAAPCYQKIMGRGRNRTIFYRRDQFVEHLNQTHRSVPLNMVLTQSYFTVPAIFDRQCVMCSHYHRDWDDRIQHLADHFEGKVRRPRGRKRPHQGADGDDSEDDNDGSDDSDDEDDEDDPSRPPAKKPRSSSKGKFKNRNQENTSRPSASTYNNTTSTPEARISGFLFSSSASNTNLELCNTLEIYALHESIGSSIKERILEMRVPSTWSNSCYFIPNDVLQGILTKDNILKEIVTSNSDANHAGLRQDEVVSYVQQSATKVFAILACIGQSKLIEMFIAARISDSDLPLSFGETSRGRITLNTKWTRAHQTVFKALSKWDVHEFCRTQWSFIAPVFEFRPDVPHYEFDSDCMLPFIETDEDSATLKHAGGYGEVWRVKIHPAHQKVSDETDCRRTSYDAIALKRLHSTNKESFEAEVSMLKAFRGTKNHPHLIKLLATYNLRGNYHLMFPHADDNLRSYWEKHEPPCIYSDTYQWFLKQCQGLASGLALIHNYRTESTDSEELYGRHGDIKPDNILWFSDTSEDPNGVLQIADFGLSRFHGRSSRSLVDPSTVGGSPTYAPPELALKLPISRAYDMWSLGCLYLEFLTWLVCGTDVLKSFSNSIENGYFTICRPPDGKGPSAAIKHSVAKWTTGLRIHTRYSKFTLEMLALIEGSLLLVDPKQRMSAKEVDQALHRMLERAENDSSYFVGKVRRATIPQSGNTKMNSASWIQSMSHSPQSQERALVLYKDFHQLGNPPNLTELKHPIKKSGILPDTPSFEYVLPQENPSSCEKSVNRFRVVAATIHDNSSIHANRGSSPVTIMEVGGKGNQLEEGPDLEITEVKTTIDDRWRGSQLECWVYEVSDTRLTLTERLERSNWGCAREWDASFQGYP